MARLFQQRSQARLIRFDETIGDASLADQEPSLIDRFRTPQTTDAPATLARTTLMNRRGEGVAIILDRSERLSGRRPVYELLDESELRLTIFAAGIGEDDRE